MHPLDFDGCVVISLTLISDQTGVIARQFFFTRDMAKSGRFIFDQMDAT